MGNQFNLNPIQPKVLPKLNQGDIVVFKASVLEGIIEVPYIVKIGNGYELVCLETGRSKTDKFDNIDDLQAYVRNDRRVSKIYRQAIFTMTEGEKIYE